MMQVNFMAQKTVMLTFLFLIFVLYNFGSIAASRNNIHIHIHPPSPAMPRCPQPPTHWYKPNDEIGGSDAFRPTSPGHSPGVGHRTPPTKQ
ncbi:hypothetical protein VNO78_27189 [Psophocarpus tetragonolobus]|uniref:Uncharacterized protein n=1 Tax=Psophocarpus tetragonolobus TaxID=3891 RepID=A0AAN9XAY5_PSOTE